MIYRNQSCISIHLNRSDSTYKNYENLRVVFEVGLVNIDGSITNQTQGKFDVINYWHNEKMGRLINYKELNSYQRKWKLISNKKLTVVLRLDLIENMKLPPQLNAMSSQYEKLFNNEKFSDFTLVTAEAKEIPVHKNILSIRSPVFETMMETKMRENKECKATIDDIGEKALFEFLRFVYCGRVEGIDEEARELLYAATKYDVSDLKPLCVVSLAEHLSLANVIDTMMLADLHGEKYLKKFCIDFVKW